jgi:hypothetical protein
VDASLLIFDWNLCNQGLFSCYLGEVSEISAFLSLCYQMFMVICLIHARHFAL